MVQIYDVLCQRHLPAGDWRKKLHQALLVNPMAAVIAEELRYPAALSDLAVKLTERIGRNVSEAELLCYLVLGAAALFENRAVFRPVVHGFLRGIPGAVVTFPVEQEGPRLWLSGEDEKLSSGGECDYWPLRVFTCTTCGQHYFIRYVKDFTAVP